MFTYLTDINMYWTFVLVLLQTNERKHRQKWVEQLLIFILFCYEMIITKVNTYRYTLIPVCILSTWHLFTYLVNAYRYKLFYVKHFINLAPVILLSHQRVRKYNFLKSSTHPLIAKHYNICHNLLSNLT